MSKIMSTTTSFFQNSHSNNRGNVDVDIVAEGCGSCNISGGGCSIKSCNGSGSGSRKNTNKRSNNHGASELMTDADLAKEMNELSVLERQQVLEELHGVHELPFEETTEFLESKYNEFDLALKKISKAKRNKLDKAIFMRPSYGTNRKFKLMFLRADIYDCNKASIRMCKFFNWKSKLYGDNKLGCDITINDLDSQTLNVAVLSGGCLQLPNKDPTGRPITFFDASKIDTNYHIEMLRFSFYLMMSIVVDDEICQKKGITNLTYMTMRETTNNHNMPITKVTNDLRSSGDLMSSLPVRITGYHYITDNPAFQFLLTMIRIALGKQVRLRLRTHLGSAIELKYSLLTFGIDCKNLLDSHDNEGKTALHDEYLSRRRQIESSKAELRHKEETSTKLVEFPTDNDVLIGRGRPYHEFAGTRRLISKIDTQLDRYYKMDNANTEDDSRFWKTCINIEMVKAVRDANGRFLQRSPQGWKILKDQQSREKTANLFRYRYNIINNPRNNKAVASNSNNNNKKQQQHQPQMMISSPPLPLSSSSSGGGGGRGAQKRLREEESNDMTMIISDDIFDDNTNTTDHFVHCNNEGRNIMMISNKRPASASPTAPDKPLPFIFWGNSSSRGDGSSGMMNHSNNNSNNNNHGNSIFQIISSPQPSSSRM